MDKPDRVVVALTVERKAALARNRGDLVITIDEQLMARGWSVDENGQLVRAGTSTTSSADLRPKHEAAERRGPGRPRGSKNRPKAEIESEGESSADGDH